MFFGESLITNQPCAFVRGWFYSIQNPGYAALFLDLIQNRYAEELDHRANAPVPVSSLFL